VEIEGALWGTADDKPFRSVLNLAALYIESGRYEKAERLGLRSLAAQRATQRNELDFARLLLLLGDLDEHRRGYEKAQEYDERALAIFEKSVPNGREILETLNNLCVLYRESGRNADALSRCERALRIAEGMGNLEPSMQALLLANVGTLQFLVRGPAEAEPFYAKALAIAESWLGSEHPLLGCILFSYADLLERTNRKTQAKKCRRRAKAIMEAASTADSRKYTVDLSDLLRRESHR
jgi:tetratricopeptide (TPR) repeat protein